MNTRLSSVLNNATHPARWLAVITLLLPCAVLSTVAAPLDPATAEVKATFRQLGVPVTGVFRRVKGELEFDPQKPATAKALVDIDTDSFDLGDKDYNAEVAKKDWFDSRRYPKATFVLTAVSAAAAGAYTAEGRLSIKGQTQTLRLPVTVSSRGELRVFEGRLPISRLAFGVGEGEWKDTSLVADEVVIQFRLAAPAAATRK